MSQAFCHRWAAYLVLGMSMPGPSALLHSLAVGCISRAKGVIQSGFLMRSNLLEQRAAEPAVVGLQILKYTAKHTCALVPGASSPGPDADRVVGRCHQTLDACPPQQPCDRSGPPEAPHMLTYSRRSPTLHVNLLVSGKFVCASWNCMHNSLHA